MYRAKSPEPKHTEDISKSIKVIDQETVQKICSGQVIINLAIAIKELVENSLDAGATIIEVKLKEYGLESIEVSDNGCGVVEDDFEGLTSRYSTSKIRDFSDLESVGTFGFRGEALNSLCTLADMIIVTRHKSTDIATKLEFNQSGNIIKKSPCSRQVGTTITLKNIFNTLPVRKKNYSKNIKKEFLKMCQILQGYCLVSKNVRIICTNQTQNGTRNTFLCTNGSNNIRDNIRAIFDNKQLTNLIEIKPPLDENEKFTIENVSSLSDSNDTNITLKAGDIEKLNDIEFNIDGWISSCAHGCGRSSKDRQYFYVNSRPCEPKNIIKLVNDVYHRFNSNQYPFVYMNISIEKSEVDVNLTPDKRMLLINNEKLLLMVIKKALLRTFSNIPSSFQIQNPQIDFILKQQHDRNSTEMDSDDEIKMIPNSQKFKESLIKWKATGNTDGPYKPAKTIKRKRDEEFDAIKSKINKMQNILNYDIPKLVNLKNNEQIDKNITSYMSESDSNSVEDNENQEIIVGNCSKIHSEETKHKNNDENDELVKRIDCKVKNIGPSTSSQLIFETKKNFSIKTDKDNIEIDNKSNDENLTQMTILDSDDDCNEMNFTTNSTEIDITIDEIKKLALDEERLQDEISKNKLEIFNKFSAEINPDKNDRAEEELKREITKDMFVKMEIIGQFNLGFIIVKLDENLFIIDQHATDEKYNFEILQKTTKLQYQPLTIPQNLELTAVNEMILISNLEVFEANGFRFQIDETAPVRKKVKLIGKPFSKNWEFGINDIEELIFMLQDAPEGTMCRPSRMLAMFASRACRKSIMIGKALNKSLMRRLVDHMGELDHPWNCPHGRPTMRHLVNLDMLKEN